MEHKIGEIFKYNVEWYQCLIGKSCRECDFSSNNITCDIHGTLICTCKGRGDETSVVFKKLEKVGEPFSCNYYGDSRLVMMQEYQLFDSNVIYCYQTPPMYITDYKHKRIAIEIKQTKEDMEENKLNLNPFDIQKAREGKPVCTRDGRKVRIICFDAKDTQPIIGLYEKNIDGIVREYLCSYHTDGRIYDDQDTGYDLMMLPEKKEGWVNVYKERCYESKEEAIRHIAPGTHYIDTIRVEWEDKE